MVVLTYRVCVQVSRNCIIPLKVQIWMMALCLRYLPNPFKAFQTCLEVLYFPLLPQATMTIGICGDLPARRLVSIRIDFSVRQRFYLASFTRDTLLASKTNMLLHAFRDPAVPAALALLFLQDLQGSQVASAVPT